MKKYIGLDVYDIPKEDRPYYNYVAVIDDDGKEYGFYVDRSLSGIHQRNEQTGDFRQLTGYMQFYLGNSKAAARKQLVKEMEYYKNNQ